MAAGDWACSSDVGCADTGDTLSILDDGWVFRALGLGLELGGGKVAATAVLSSSGLPVPVPVPVPVPSPFVVIWVFAFLDRRQKKNAARPIRVSPPTTPTTAPTMTPIFVEARWELSPPPLLELPLPEPSEFESPEPESPRPESPESDVGSDVCVGPEETVLPVLAVCDTTSYVSIGSRHIVYHISV